MDIKQLQSLYDASDSNIKWAKHCLERMQERDISIDDVEFCLIFGRTKGNKVLHIVVGANSDTIFFITAYYPNTDKFEADLKTRKE